MTVQKVVVKGEFFYYSDDLKRYWNTLKTNDIFKCDKMELAIRAEIKEQLNQKVEFLKVKKFTKSYEKS